MIKKNPLYLHPYGQNKVKGHFMRVRHPADAAVRSLYYKRYVRALSHYAGYPWIKGFY